MRALQKLPERADKRRQRGQGLVEYALILVLVAVVVILILPVLGNAIAGIYANIICELDSNNCPSSTSGCATEDIDFVASCSGADLVMSATSSCAGATIRLDPRSPILDGCGSHPLVTITSTHPDGTVKSYTAPVP